MMTAAFHNFARPRLKGAAFGFPVQGGSGVSKKSVSLTGSLLKSNKETDYQGVEICRPKLFCGVSPSD